MPRYGSAKTVAVNMPGSATTMYGFNTKVDAADSTTLGHVVLGAANPTKVVLFGCNSRKPSRAKKRKASGAVESSFVDAGAETAAKAAGWSISKSRTTIYKDTARVQRKKAKLAAGVFIGWAMPKETEARLEAAAATAAGITSVTTGDTGVFYGVNSAILTNGDRITRKQLKGRVNSTVEGKSVTTYVAYDLTADPAP